MYFFFIIIPTLNIIFKIFSNYQNISIPHSHFASFCHLYKITYNGMKYFALISLIFISRKQGFGSLSNSLSHCNPLTHRQRVARILSGPRQAYPNASALKRGLIVIGLSIEPNECPTCRSLCKYDCSRSKWDVNLVVGRRIGD